MLDRPMVRSSNNQRSLQQSLSADALGISNAERGVQIFDREAIVTLMLLYFLDHDKFSLLRIQVKKIFFLI